MISSTSSRIGSGSAKTRLTSTSDRNRSRRPGSRLATAWTGQPARVRATPSAVPTAPAPTMPMTGGSPGSEWACGWTWSLGCVSSPWRWEPGGTGSRSIPAASISACVSARSRSGSSPGRSPQALIERGPGSSSGLVGAALVECTERVRPDGSTRGDSPYTGRELRPGVGAPARRRLTPRNRAVDEGGAS